MGSDPRHFDLELAQDPASSESAPRAPPPRPPPAERRLTSCAAAPLFRSRLHARSSAAVPRVAGLPVDSVDFETSSCWALCGLRVVSHVPTCPQGTGWWPGCRNWWRWASGWPPAPLKLSGRSVSPCRCVRARPLVTQIPRSNPGDSCRAFRSYWLDSSLGRCNCTPHHSMMCHRALYSPAVSINIAASACRRQDAHEAVRGSRCKRAVCSPPQAAMIAKFAQAGDPLQPGARLLEQYQAQLVSSLRCLAPRHPAAPLFPSRCLSGRAALPVTPPCRHRQFWQWMPAAANLPRDGPCAP